MALTLKEQVITLAYQLLGKNIEGYVSNNESFNNLRANVKISNIGMTLTEYLSLSIIGVLLSFVFATPILSVFIYFITMDLFFSVFLSLFSAFFISFGVLSVFLVIPSMIRGEREKKIEDILPFALSYLTIMASAQNPSVSMFKTLARFSEYGEVSVEARQIVEEVELMGVNFNSALVHATERTPSKTFKNVLWGIKSTIESGGNLKQYLRECSSEAMNSYKLRLAKYENQVTLLTEIYLTAVVVGSIFIIIISVIFSVIGGMDSQMIITLQLVIIILVLPFSAGGFLLIERGIAPAGV